MEKWNYRNSELSAKERAALLLADMSLEEKIGQINGILPIAGCDPEYADSLLEKHPYGVGGVSCLYMSYNNSLEEQIAFQKYYQKRIMEMSPHHIPAIFHLEGLTGAHVAGTMSFPSGIARGASFDPELEYQIGAIVGKSERAVGATHTFAPVLDVSRDPRLGREGESYSEDPTLTASMGVQYVKGLQENSRPDGLKTESVAKHYMGFHTGMAGIHGAESELSRRILMEVYGKPFQAAIREADLRGVMPCYNSINGVDCSVSKEMLTDLLREEMGFDGVAVSDYGALSNAYEVKGVGESADETGYMALKAGMNMELPETTCYNEALLKGFADGTYDMEVLDRSVRAILEAKFRMGLFEHPYALDLKEAEKEIHTENEKKVAHQMAGESMVLLKNDGILPLKADRLCGKKIAVIGQQGQDSKILFGGYTKYSMVEATRAARQSMAGIGDIDEKNGVNVRTYPGTGVEMDKEAFVKLFAEYYPQIDTIQSALQKQLPDTQVCYSYGYPIAGNDTSHFKEALELCGEADLIILMLGGKYSQGSQSSMGEGVDGTDINLPACQEVFLKQAASFEKPMIGIHLGGRPVSSDNADRYLNALLEAWAPAETGAEVIAEILCGTINPSGKLPVSIAYQAGQIPVVYNHRRGSAKHQSMSIGFREYVDCPHTPRYPFGFGLSYTQFSYGELCLEKTDVKPADVVEASVSVTNSGNVAGTEIVQFYTEDRRASVVRPNMELVGFGRVSLEPRETKTLKLHLPVRALAFPDVNLEWKIEKGEFCLMVGSSSVDLKRKKYFHVIENQFLKGKERSFYGRVEICD